MVLCSIWVPYCKTSISRPLYWRAHFKCASVLQALKHEFTSRRHIKVGKKEEIVHLNHVQCMNTNLSERKACVSLFESVSVFLFFSWPPFYSFCVLFSQETKRGAQVWFPVGSYLRTWWPVPHQSQRTQTQVTHSSLLLFFTVIHL